jgi:STAM-binding protein
VAHSLRELEALKPIINAKYDQYQKTIRSREEARATKSATDAHHLEHGYSSAQDKQDVLRSDSTLPATRPAYSDEGFRLATQEMRRLAAHRSKPETISAKSTEREGLHGRRPPTDDYNLAQAMHNVRRALEGKSPLDTSRKIQTQPARNVAHARYDYPSVPARSQESPLSPSPMTSPSASPSPVPQKTSAPPPLPPKPFKPSSDLPARPPKEVGGPLQNTPSPEPPSEDSPTFLPRAYLENGQSLRTIFCPSDLRQRFLDIAAPNTFAKLETCGILCGSLKSNALFVEQLVIPEQVNTSDTCEMTNDSDLFDYVDSEGLLSLGWIHTHPTQTCFMSSRDLHTHCAYQAMMPESIAIVCAPRMNELSTLRPYTRSGQHQANCCKFSQLGYISPHRPPWYEDHSILSPFRHFSPAFQRPCLYGRTSSWSRRRTPRAPLYGVRHAACQVIPQNVHRVLFIERKRNIRLLSIPSDVAGRSAVHSCLRSMPQF